MFLILAYAATAVAAVSDLISLKYSTNYPHVMYSF